MGSGGFHFDQFRIDPDNRQLTRDGRPVELNARYLDALVLMVREPGALISKDRFLQEVWRGVPVTDEALTQCIRTLRRQLGDDAARPRLIETVPKHGYRFIAPVRREEAEQSTIEPYDEGSKRRSSDQNWQRLLLLGAAGTAGGAVAGTIGGLFYGFAAASRAGPGAVSVVVILMLVTILLAMLGAAGVAFGIAAANFARSPHGLWSIVGGAVGGAVVGGIAKLLALDAFHLLFGQAPSDLTGAPEGALLGATVGLGAWLGNRSTQDAGLRRSVIAAGIAGLAAGVTIVASGGQLFGGSLDLLASGFPESRLSLDQIGALLGESGFGSASALATAALEGLLFAGCVVGAMVIAGRGRLRPRGSARD